MSRLWGEANVLVLQVLNNGFLAPELRQFAALSRTRRGGAGEPVPLVVPVISAAKRPSARSTSR
jgi:hypothetical protein